MPGPVLYSRNPAQKKNLQASSSGMISFSNWWYIYFLFWGFHGLFLVIIDNSSIGETLLFYFLTRTAKGDQSAAANTTRTGFVLCHFCSVVFWSHQDQVWFGCGGDYARGVVKPDSTFDVQEAVCLSEATFLSLIGLALFFFLLFLISVQKSTLHRVNSRSVLVFF